MELGLDTLSEYGSHTPTRADLLTTLDALEAGDLYGIEDYQRYFPRGRDGDVTDHEIVDRYPQHMRRRVGHAIADGALDRDYFDQEVAPDASIPARWELAEYVWDGDEHLFLVDDHNHAAAAWAAAYHDGVVDRDTTVLHVDRHADDADPYAEHDTPRRDPPTTVREAEQRIGLGLTIGAFITPAVTHWGIIGQDGVEDWGVGNGPHDPADIGAVVDDADTLVLDLDIDVFHDPDGSRIPDHDAAYDEVRAAHEEAALTTVALSPGYIPHREAEHHLDAVFG